MGNIEFETEDDAPVSSALSLRVHQPHLFVVLEADRPWSRGARHSLVGVDEIVIGRGTERAVDRRKTEGKTVLTVYVPGRWMSSKHTRLIRVGRRWSIE